MAKNIMKKTLCLAIAVTSACVSLATMTACETSHPKVEMVLEFNNETYTLEYNLNRNLTPATVKHFLELVDVNFYDGICIHDYKDTDWYTGVYEYKEEDSTLSYKSYIEAVRKIEEKGTFAYTVWGDAQKEDPTYTLYGEFKDNNFRTENGSVSNGFGSLTMRYMDKGDDADISVFCQHANGKESWKDYGYNSATSMFSINVSTSKTPYTEYCTFAELDEDSVEVLQDLKSAISDYMGEENLDEFTIETETVINVEDKYAQETEGKFKTPVKPIKIQTMKVTKW